MQRLSEQQIISRIRAGDVFECESQGGEFRLKIDRYTPAICTAIHDGHQMRASVVAHCALSEVERLYEEDPHTGEMIDAMPITLIGMDSRYEYDLNRPVATCIYRQAWGKNVWQKPLRGSQRKKSIEKHRLFYRVLNALISEVERRFGAAVLFDMHSYNHLRHESDTPTFNLGTEQVDMERWAPVVQRFERTLQDLALSNTPVQAACNEVFYGRGYLIAHVNSRFENTLVLPCEVKKVFMDELSGEPYRLLLNELKEGLKHCLSDTAAFFTRRHTRRARARRLEMLSSQLDPAIRDLDRQLYRLARGLETLHYINPINIQQEKKRFFSRRSNYQPQFRYRPLAVDPYAFREQLYRLPVDQVRDPDIQQLYRQVIDSLSSKIDLLVSSGTPQFVYSSLKYYGEPSMTDEANAHFLLHAACVEAPEPAQLSAEQALPYFRQQAQQWQMNCRVELSSRLVASAMVSGSKRTLYINRDHMFSVSWMSALAHHELGVHMATTLNAAEQPLKVFNLGLPGNTLTQEGLAILNEFHSGNINLARLQGLAQRVLAVREMLAVGDFRHTWSYLREELKMTDDAAFNLAVRVHRGGGFTKDYVYLRGVSEALRLYQQRPLTSLYIGKTGFDYLPLLDELIARGILTTPRFVPENLAAPMPCGDVLSYLIQSIQPTILGTGVSGGARIRAA